MPEVYHLTEEELEQKMTKGAHAMLEHLAATGLLDVNKAAELQRTKIVLIRKKSQICQIWRKVFRQVEVEQRHILIATIPDLGGPNELCD